MKRTENFGTATVSLAVFFARMQNVHARLSSQLSPTLSPNSPFTVTAPFTSALPVVGYARVSTDLQREKETIKTQVELIERYCVEKGYRLVEMICDDGVSGTLPLEQRLGGQRLLELARSGKVAGLLVYKADRIGRDVWVNEMAVRQLHDELGVDFIGVAEKIDLSTPIGRAMFTFQSAIGRLERESTLQRSRDATIRLAREGAWLGGIVPYGYRVEGKDRDARLRIAHEVDPQTGMSEADVVRMMFEWSSRDGLSSVQIATRLNDLGIPTAYVRDEREVRVKGEDGAGKRKAKTRGVWRGGRVRNMLIEPTYKGLHTWGRRGSKRRRKDKDTEKTLVERQVPAIIDEETWNNAQLTLARNRIARPDIVKRPYLLRGLMKCKHCGLTYIGTVSQGKLAGKLTQSEFEELEISGDYLLRPYYMCNGRNFAHRTKGPDALNCPSGHIRAKELEALVWGEIEGFLNHPDGVIGELEHLLRERLGEGVGESTLFVELEELKADAAGKEAERNALYRLFSKGMLPETDLESQLNELRAEEVALAERLGQVETAVEKAKDARSSLDGARALLNDLREKVEADDSWSSRRRVVETLVAGTEIETLAKGADVRGRGKAVTIRVNYRFETPTLEDLTPQVVAPYSGRSGHTVANVLGLSLSRTHENLNFAFDPFAAARDAAREILQAHPDMYAKDVIAQVVAQTGESISSASVSRMRSRLKKVT